MPTSSWGIGTREMVADGSPAPPAPSRARNWLLVAASTAGILVGLIVGAGTDIPGRATSEDTPLAAGAVTEVVGGPARGWDFALPVFNSTDAPVDASVAEFEGVTWAVTSDRAENLVAGTWGVIPFSTTANCDLGPPGPVSSVRLRVVTEGGESLTDLPLPGEGKALRDYHRRGVRHGEADRPGRARRSLVGGEGVRPGHRVRRNPPAQLRT